MRRCHPGLGKGKQLKVFPRLGRKGVGLAGLQRGVAGPKVFPAALVIQRLCTRLDWKWGGWRGQAVVCHNWV